MLKFENVTKKYNKGTIAIRDINFEIKKGEFVYLIGPSGSGKTTLTKLLYHEIKATSGKITLDEQDITKLWNFKIPKLRRKIGVIFQDYKLLPNKTVYSNVAFALECVGTPRNKIKKRVLLVLELVGLKEKARYYPRQLSGGEQQRVSIARAIVNQPRLLICDEPTGNLDPDTAIEIMDVLTKINQVGTTVIMLTHDRTIVNTIKRRVIALENGFLVSDEEKGVYRYND